MQFEIYQNTLTGFNDREYPVNIGVTIPNGIKKIGNHVFLNSCHGKFVFPKSLEIISFSAFAGCKNMDMNHLSDTALKTISENAFKDCSRLSSVKLPYSLETIGPGAFHNCPIGDATICYNGYPERYAIKVPFNDKEWKAMKEDFRIKLIAKDKPKASNNNNEITEVLIAQMNVLYKTLTEKDNRIGELTQQVIMLNKDLVESSAKKLALDKSVNELLIETNELKNKNAALQTQIQVKNKLIDELTKKLSRQKALPQEILTFYELTNDELEKLSESYK